MRILFVRHGETDWNKQKKYQGISDIPLNESGEKQAKKTAIDIEQLLVKDKQSVEAIYASDLSRAKKTATIIGARLRIEHVQEDIRLRELSFGLWEGLTFTEVFDQYRAEFDRWHQDAFSIAVPNGESLAQVVKRVMEAIREIAAQHNQGTVIVVTHGGVIKSLRAHFDQSFDLWNSDVKLASFSECKYEKGYLIF